MSRRDYGNRKRADKAGRKQRYKKKVDIKISRCSAGGSAPALGKKRERCRWQKKRAFLGLAFGMSRLIIEPKRLREPQEGVQSREENRDIRKNVDIKISRCSAGGSAPALGA